MTKKPSGLAAFTAKKPAFPAATTGAPSPAVEGMRERGRGETVALTVRVSRADWTRLHQLALSEGVSLQTLAIRGFNREMEAHGLPSLAT